MGFFSLSSCVISSLPGCGAFLPFGLPGHLYGRIGCFDVEILIPEVAIGFIFLIRELACVRISLPFNLLINFLFQL